VANYSLKLFNKSITEENIKSIILYHLMIIFLLYAFKKTNMKIKAIKNYIIRKTQAKSALSYKKKLTKS
jgi:Ca2+/Na+ antiporter